MKGIFVTLKDIQMVYGCGKTTACRKLSLVKTSLSKQRNITVREFCESEEIDMNDFYSALKIIPKGSN